MNGKKLIRQFVASEKRRKPTPLIHLMINAKSHGGHFYTRALKQFLLSRAYEWEWGKRNFFIELRSSECFTPSISRKVHGEKTYSDGEGRFFSYDPNAEFEDYPF